MVDRATAIRLLALYAPVSAAILLGLALSRPRKLFAAALAGSLWAAPSLLVLQLVNLPAGWWQFHAQGGLWRGMPVDLWLGWSVLWGLMPILAFRRLRTAYVIVLFFLLD